MAEDHKRAKDGLLDDGVYTRSADAQKMQTYEAAKESLSDFRAPIFLKRGNARQRLYVAAFDGTGNDADRNPEHATNIAEIRDQIEQLGDKRIVVGYVAGPGTQSGAWASGHDALRGHTYDERIEEMYAKFIKQAWEWKQQDPSVQISLADIGFSRGAEQATGFSRIVHERGIQNPMGAAYSKNENGEITGVRYTKPPLVAPGQVAQALGLMDPVGTGEPVNEKDRRPPPSVISGFQIRAMDDIRVDFKGSNIIDQGTNSIGRFLGVSVAGVHSDVGGGYHRNGLSNRAGNLLIDYLNSLSDRPFLEKLEEPNDPRLNVIHHSHEHRLIYGAREKIDRMSPDGTIDRLVPKNQMDRVADPYNAELRDNLLNSRFERQNIRIGPVPESQPQEQPEPRTRKNSQSLLNDSAHPDNGLYQQVLAQTMKLPRRDRASGEADETDQQLSAALAVRCKESGLTCVNHVVLSKDGSRAFAVDTPDIMSEWRKRADVEVGDAMRQPLDASTERMAQVNQDLSRQAELEKQQQIANPTSTQKGPVLA